MLAPMTANVNAPRRGPAVTVARAAAVVISLVMIVAISVMAGGAVAGAQELDENDLPVTTVFNEFYPEDRDLSDCLSVLPKPGCGSSARSGWPQLVVFSLILVGVGVVAARVIISARRNRAAFAGGSDGSGPDDTGPDDSGPDRADTADESSTA